MMTILAIILSGIVGAALYGIGFRHSHDCHRRQYVCCLKLVQKMRASSPPALGQKPIITPPPPPKRTVKTC